MSTLLVNSMPGYLDKVQGMAAAAKSRKALLQEVRAAVVEIAAQRVSKCATADDAQTWLVSKGYTSASLGNAAGRLFTNPMWEFTGAWEPSTRQSNHARENRVWRLRN